MPAESIPGQHPPSRIELSAVMLFVVVIWSINYTVGKIGFHYLPPLALSAFRITTAGVAMLPVAIWLAVKERRQAQAGKMSRLKRLSIGDLWNFACLGFFGVFINQGVFTYALSMTSVGHSAIVVATTPIFIVLAAWLDGLEGLTRRKVLGLIVAFAGALILGADRGWDWRSAGSQGDMLTFVACLSVVVFTVLGKRMGKSYDALQLMAYNVTISGLFAFPFAVWQAHALIRAGEWNAISWQGWGAVAYMGVLSSAVSIPLYYWVLRWVPPSKIGALSYLQPVFGAPFAALVLGEPLTRDLLSGGALILAGVYAIESDISEREQLLSSSTLT